MVMIDFDKAKKSLEDFRDELKKLKCHKSAGTVQRCIDRLEEQEPKEGHWIECKGNSGDVYYECSACGEPYLLIDGTPKDNSYNYCPNCGVLLFGLKRK